MFGGAEIPFILRPFKNEGGGEEWMVGDCYLEGWMDGKYFGFDIRDDGSSGTNGTSNHERDGNPAQSSGLVGRNVLKGGLFTLCQSTRHAASRQFASVRASILHLKGRPRRLARKAIRAAVSAYPRNCCTTSACVGIQSHARLGTATNDHAPNVTTPGRLATRFPTLSLQPFTQSRRTSACIPACAKRLLHF